MPGISIPGIGSGLDVNSIVSQLMSLEQRPLVALQQRSQELTVQISGYGTLKSAMSGLQSAMGSLDDLEKFKVFKTTVGSTDTLSATASSAAATGNYQLEVVRLAETARMIGGASVADTTTTKLGTAGDTLSIQVGSGSFTVATGDKTLAEVRDAINKATDNKGVTASIIRDNNGNRLVLSSNKTGADGFLVTTYNGASDPFAMAITNTDRNSSGGVTAEDLNAEIRIEDTYVLNSSSNTISDAIEGVTLTLKEVGTTSLGVARDTASVQNSIRGFVSAYNAVVKTMEELRTKDLAQDRSLLTNINARMRAVMNRATDLSSSFSLPYELGISTEKAGTLTLDSTALGKALERDFDGVARMFSDSKDGLAVRMQDLADDLLSSGGVLQGRSESLSTQTRDIEKRGLALQARLVTKEQSLLAQFSALEGTIVQLKSTGDALTSSLDAIAASFRKS